MNTILHVDASPSGASSVSRQLTASVVQQLKTSEPSSLVIERDLTASPIPHLGSELLQVLRPAPGVIPPDNEAIRADLALTEEVLAEFLAADIIVIGAPMLNFSIPSQLKAWIDRLAQPGRTFRYTEKGPIGLAGGKKVIIVSARGGMYAGTPYEAVLDHQEAYLRAVLSFFGITDIQIVRAEGLAMGSQKKAEALASARREIAALGVEYSKAA